MGKRILSIIIAIILVISSMVVYADEGTELASYEQLFAKDSVIDINIEISEEDLQDMYDYPKNQEYHSANITVARIEMKNSGIRTKGNFTLSSVASSDSDRYSYRIKFNKYVKGQNLLGLDELCLNNQYSDASYMREYLHYEMLREMGQNVPHTVFCNVYINGELYGFYLAVEAVDDSFLERNYGEEQNGNLYKMEEGASLVYREDENYTYGELKSGDDTERTGFKNFIKVLNNGDKEEIESVLDVDSALVHIAANTVLCNYDSYNNSMKHNYYLYEDDNGIFSVLTWDLNMSFGGRESNTNVGIDTPLVSGSMEDSPLISKLLAIDEYKEKYYNYIKEMMAWLENFETRVSELKAVIKPYVENDPSAFYTVEQFEKATTYQEVTEQPAENPEEQTEEKTNDRRGGFGGGFGGFGGGFSNGKSIVNLMVERLENLKAQFDGIAEKSTLSEQSGGFGGFGGRNRGDFQMPEGMDFEKMRENFQMPEGMDFEKMRENFQMPEGFDFEKMRENGEMPQFNFGGNGNPPENGGKMPERGKGFGFNSKTKGDKIRVHVDGHIINFETDPILENDTTLVGFRAILEALGAEVIWDESTQTVTAVKDDTEIVLNIGSDTAYVNGEAVKLLAASQIIGDSTMIPLRFVSESLGMKVEWDEDAYLITVDSK